VKEGYIMWFCNFNVSSEGRGCDTATHFHCFVSCNRGQ